MNCVTRNNHLESFLWPQTHMGSVCEVGGHFPSNFALITIHNRISRGSQVIKAIGLVLRSGLGIRF
jgi:hypothetical protein